MTTCLPRHPAAEPGVDAAVVGVEPECVGSPSRRGLRTSPRFVRRLIAERRIAFTKVGKFVRITAADVQAFIAHGRVEPGVSYVRPNALSEGKARRS